VILKKIADFVLFSSIFIASCAVALCMQTSLVLRLPLNPFSFYCFVFGATLAQYNLHYLVKTKAIPDSQRLAWSLKNKKTHKILFVSGIILIIISFFSFRLHHFIILGIMGVISVLYSFPVIPTGNKKRIKDYGYLKIITLALLWTLVTVWFPVVNKPFDNTLFLFVFMKRFVFMFVLCLVFDIRDIEIDNKENINTVAVILGRKNSYLLAYFTLLLFMVLSLLQNFYFSDNRELFAMLVSAILSYFTIEVSKKNNSDIIYLAGIDGIMLLQPLLVYLFSLKF
jgi:4-hydroxybenzoate polyprenyltransferase